MNGWITIGTKLETKQFDKQIEKLERDINDYENILKLASKLELSSADVEELELKIEKAKNSIISLKKQQMKVNDIGFNEASNGLEKISDSTSNIIKKIGRWALAVFSVRSAYMFVQRASSTLAQYNEDYAASLEYIRFVVAQMIAPVLQGIVNLAFRLLSYINAIANAWFGINLFSKAGVKNFNKMAGAAASIKKSLQTAGFDEMNVLSDTSSGGGGVGGGTPSMDLSQMQGEIPSWVQWIADNKDTVIAALVGIAGGITAINTGLGIFKGLGIGLILGGIVALVQDIIDFINDPSWQKFGEILIDIGIIVGGLAIIIGGLPLAIASAIAIILGLIITNWDKVGVIFKAGADTVWSIIKLLISMIDGIFTTVTGIITLPFKIGADTIKGIFNGVKTFFKGFAQTIKSLFNGDIKGVFNGFKTSFKGIMNSLWSIAKAPLNLIIGGLNTLIRGANRIKFDVPDWVPGLGGKRFGFNIPTIPKLASGAIVNLPGRGVYSNGTIRGEAGAEGVLPLTDSQTMERLGEAIGRYININATVINKMNSRVISRELQKIQANQDFAYNT